MIARVPVYGTTDASRNLYLRIIRRAVKTLSLGRPRFFLPCISVQERTTSYALQSALTWMISYGPPYRMASQSCNDC